jgi:hypothetical protein
MSGDQLADLVPPTAAPVGAVGDWDDVRNQLAVLPSDYVQMVTMYGAGCFGGFIWLFSPFFRQPASQLD